MELKHCYYVPGYSSRNLAIISYARSDGRPTFCSKEEILEKYPKAEFITEAEAIERVKGKEQVVREIPESEFTEMQKLMYSGGRYKAIHSESFRLSEETICGYEFYVRLKQQYFKVVASPSTTHDELVKLCKRAVKLKQA